MNACQEEGQCIGACEVCYNDMERERSQGVEGLRAVDSASLLDRHDGTADDNVFAEAMRALDEENFIGERSDNGVGNYVVAAIASKPAENVMGYRMRLVAAVNADAAVGAALRIFKEQEPDFMFSEATALSIDAFLTDGEDIHADDAAVDHFADAMRAKLAQKREEGRGGWQDCSGEYLSKLLHEHVQKGDPVDVANIAMMLHQNGQSIVSGQAEDQDAWRPIGSIPKDGTIVWVRDLNGCTSRARFDPRFAGGSIVYVNRKGRALGKAYGLSWWCPDA